MTKQEIRDDLLRRVWVVMRDLSDNPESMTKEDLDVWDAVAKHSAIQSRLDQAKGTKKLTTVS